jgi:hypothetical protein
MMMIPLLEVLRKVTLNFKQNNQSPGRYLKPEHSECNVADLTT